MQSSEYKNKLYLLLLISFVIRAFLAAWHELGNDEVYYYTYALFPDWSHFDHPPMIGWMIQLFSLNLIFDSELFLRLSSVVLMTANTLIAYQIGKTIKDDRTGWYAALLYTGSVYAFVITGFMILPDTPQNFFWMISLWLMALTLKNNITNFQRDWLFVAIGFSIGLGMISKYTSVILWLGFGLYILVYQREWLRRPSLYLAVLLSSACLLPVIWWNMQNNFISFSFQGDRINIFDASFRPDLFFTELGGQIVYNNPVNFVLIAAAVFGLFRKPFWLEKKFIQLFLLLGIPLIFIFLFFSLFRSTLPHWTGPAYNTLLFLAAARLSSLRKDWLPLSIKFSLLVLLIFITVGSLQIKFGIIPIKDQQAFHRLGRNDVTLDMVGYRKLLPAFMQVRADHIQAGNMSEEDGIVGENWFPLANLDYYIARPLGMKVLGLGEPQRLHKYLWINELRGGFHKGDDFWYITNSRDYKHPEEVYDQKFEQIIAVDTIEIERGGQVAKRYFVFLLKDLKEVPPLYLTKK